MTRPSNRVTVLDTLALEPIRTLAFAGGGNRCWWQAGALAHLMGEGWQLPPQLVGTSAGAGVAAACMTSGPAAALAACARLYSANPRLLEGSGMARLRLRFAHQRIYPAWIASFVHAGSLGAMHQSASRLRVGITRPARVLGLAGSVAVGTVAYVVDKHVWNSIHPRLPRWLGLRQDFVDLHDCATLADAQNLLSAAAAAPPFMASRRVGAAMAMDGGYTDNAPIHAQSAADGARTLVLLTRHYPALPPLFRHGGRAYWQPSQRVPVSTWDCTPRTTVREAYALGTADARQLFDGMRLRV